MTREMGSAAAASLGAHFAEIGAVLTSATGGAIEPGRVVRFGARILPGTEHCGLTLIRAQHPPRTLAASDPLPEQVDALQYAVGEGPCLDAASEGVELTGDLEGDDRWPVFGPSCVERTGVHSMLSVRLTVTGSDLAALNFYTRDADAFGDEAVDVASVLAPFASLSVEHALRVQDTSNFEAALSSSRQIGTAIGIIMARRLVTSEEAFDLLRATSQRLNRKLREVAAQVEQTGELPEPRRTGQPASGTAAAG